MPSLFPACFGGGGDDAQTAGPCSTTSVYDTPAGLAVLTWCRSVLGISLCVDLRVPVTAAPNAELSPASSAVSADPPCFTALRFRLLPVLPWRRSGSRRFRLGDPSRSVVVGWDLSRAEFHPGGSPEPRSRFSLSITLDGEPFLNAGDLKARARACPIPPSPASRTEHVVLTGGGAAYATSVAVAGREREVAFELPGADKDARMWISIDGRKVLQVKRLRWKFRGNERVEADGGGAGGLLVSWDVHSWLFPNGAEGPPAGVDPPPAARPELGYAVIILRFDGDGVWGGGGRGLWGLQGALAGENIGGEGRKGWGKRRRSRLLKARSSSSSASSASSMGSSSVMEWASAEENELREAEGFSLVVYVWRS